MSLKSSLIALAENIGMCQENSRSIKQALAGGLADAAANAPGIDGGAESVKIWTNSTPAAAMDETDLTIDNADVYDGFYIIARPLSSNISMTYFIDASAINDDATYEIHHTYVSSGQVYNARRTVKLTQAEGSSSVKFAFSKGNTRHIDPYGTATSFTANNNVVIPLYIIGVKF